MSDRASANKAFNEKCNKLIFFKRFFRLELNLIVVSKSNEYAKRQGARNWSDVTTAELSQGARNWSDVTTAELSQGARNWSDVTTTELSQGARNWSDVTTAELSQGARNWSDVTTAELSAFVGLHVVCSVLYFSSYKQAWKTKRPFSFPAVPDTMTRSRFENIQIYFHCNDTRNNPARGQPNHDKRCHIRRILDVVLAMCKENYIPDKEQAIDEAMIGFKAGLGMGVC